jgi:NitT/TauT family transport system permease protein
MTRIPTYLRRTFRTVVSPILFAAVALLLWQILCGAFNVPRFVFPQPSEIGIMLFKRWDIIWPNALQTVGTTVSGFVIGVTAGFILGIALGASTRFHKTVFPTLIGINSIPKAALVPLLILWAGLGSLPAIITSAIIVVFPVAVVVSTSIATMDPELADVMRSLGASRLVTLTKIGIPQAMPMFLSSLRIAISLSFIGTIVAEAVASNRGLGFMMNRAASDFDEELVFAGVAVLAAIGVTFFLMSVYVERYALSWAYRRDANA